MRLNFQPKKDKIIVNNYQVKKDYSLLWTVICIVVAVIIGIVGFNIFRNNRCVNIEDSFLKIATEYAEANNLLNLDESEHIVVDINDVYSSGYETVQLNGTTCGGTVKFAMIDGSIIKTFNITDCSYCSTSKRYGSWKQTDSLNGKRLVDVNVKYNYYNSEVFYSKWTSWYPSSDINKEADTQYNVQLPLSLEDYPKIPDTAEVLKYDVEYVPYYRYRDMTWRWYKTANNNYSSWYSEKPSGYENKDEGTEKYTDWSEWSLSYPEEKTYRSIRSTVSYRWFYYENPDDIDSEKHYWNGGAYSIENPDNRYPFFDQDATMYSYRDLTWRWYNGTPREYSSEFSSIAFDEYKYVDTQFSSYTDWSEWSPTIPTNYNYRTVETDIYYRYRSSYRDVNFLVLEEYLPLNEFEQAIGTTLKNFRLDNTKKISYQYTYLYR